MHSNQHTRAGSPCMHCSINSIHEPYNKELLSQRADVNAGDNQGATALHVAAQSGFVPIIQACNACVEMCPIWKKVIRIVAVVITVFSTTIKLFNVVTIALMSAVQPLLRTNARITTSPPPTHRCYWRAAPTRLCVRTFLSRLSSSQLRH